MVYTFGAEIVADEKQQVKERELAEEDVFPRLYVAFCSDNCQALADEFFVIRISIQNRFRSTNSPGKEVFRNRIAP